MIDEKDIVGKIRQAVKSVEPDATVILYGSYARGEQTSQSDLDILIPKLSIELTILPYGLTKLLTINNLSGLTVTIENLFLVIRLIV